MGQNYYGQLGTSTTTDSLTPVKIMDDVVACSAGNNHSLAITEDGSLYAWGSNEFGQVGNDMSVNDYKSQTTPVKIMDNVVACSASSEYSLAITEDGSLYGWGLNDNGQLGDESISNAENNGWPFQSVPVKLMDDVVACSANYHHRLVITEDASLYAWGNNISGQLGDGTTTNSLTPVKIMDGVVACSAGNDHSLAITEDGSLYAWGYNSTYSSITGSSTPVKVMDNVVACSAGLNTSFAITEDGSLYASGENDHGQLGIGSISIKPIQEPTKVEFSDESSGTRNFTPIQDLIDFIDSFFE